jgi:hypothetical protein
MTVPEDTASSPVSRLDNWIMGITAIGIVVLVACQALDIKVPFLEYRNASGEPVLIGIQDDWSLPADGGVDDGL